MKILPSFPYPPLIHKASFSFLSIWENLFHSMEQPAV